MIAFFAIIVTYSEPEFLGNNNTQIKKNFTCATEKKNWNADSTRIQKLYHGTCTSRTYWQ
jgi:hypothetical protein